jgi:hypothetical protein
MAEYQRIRDSFFCEAEVAKEISKKIKELGEKIDDVKIDNWVDKIIKSD